MNELQYRPHPSRPVIDGQDIIINRTIVAGDDSHYLYCKFGCIGPEQRYITPLHKELGFVEDVPTLVRGNVEIVTIVDRTVARFSKS